MSFATSPVKRVLGDYLAGRVPAERVVAAVTRWYYREAGRAAREAFRPVIEVIERAAPGGVELTRAEASPGFALRPGARVFPKEFEPDLRTAVETAMLRSGEPGGPQGDGRLLTRIVRALRRLFR